MIAWIFKQGMAAVAWDEKFKAIDARFDALEDRVIAELGKTRTEVILHLERMRLDLRKELSDTGASTVK